MIMFRIPSFHQETPTWAEATATITSHGRGDMLEGMMSMDRKWTEWCASGEEDDDDFYSNWCYEVNAYNVVHEGMGQLFAPKE